MDIFNENNEYTAGACSVWRVYGFGSHYDRAAFKSPEAVTLLILGAMKDYADSEIYDDAPVIESDDYNRIAHYLLSGEMSSYNATDILTAVVTTKQPGYPHMEALVAKGPWESFTSVRSDNSDGDLVFFTTTVSAFLSDVMKKYKPKTPPAPPPALPIVKRTKRTRSK